jgi:hypothetical protein
LWAELAANLVLVADLVGVGAANSLGVFAAGADYLAVQDSYGPTASVSNK